MDRLPIIAFIVALGCNLQGQTDNSSSFINNGTHFIKGSKYTIEGNMFYLATPVVQSKDYSVSSGSPLSQSVTHVFDVTTTPNSNYSVRSNPFHTEIEVLTSEKNASFTLTDLCGSVMTQTTATVIPVNQLNNGVYMLYVVENGQIVKTFKLIKQ
jgi:hypothetical protein